MDCSIDLHSAPYHSHCCAGYHRCGRYHHHYSQSNRMRQISSGNLPLCSWNIFCTKIQTNLDHQSISVHSRYDKSKLENIWKLFLFNFGLFWFFDSMIFFSGYKFKRSFWIVTKTIIIITCFSFMVFTSDNSLLKSFCFSQNKPMTSLFCFVNLLFQWFFTIH